MAGVRVEGQRETLGSGGLDSSRPGPPVPGAMGAESQRPTHITALQPLVLRYLSSPLKSPALALSTLNTHVQTFPASPGPPWFPSSPQLAFTSLQRHQREKLLGKRTFWNPPQLKLLRATQRRARKVHGGHRPTWTPGTCRDFWGSLEPCPVCPLRPPRPSPSVRRLLSPLCRLPPMAR